ncbi:Cytoplasmic dynein 2 heavy chain 1 [Talaromyces islandicus]|uniref:Cytoplasmic dynein 2 heavy chain 1 n=1 Tax=Talaromyces islandicus TaxID=28573 RepID=A0A0U1M9H6_TALIS|nr:Cytoplasmic dynein 2 heavy chain 1 [Talaromyces islandicus]
MHKEPEWYQAHVAAQCRKNPCLSSLERFLSERKESEHACRIATIDFIENEDGSKGCQNRFLHADDIKFAISSVDQPTNLKGRILIVEDVSRELMEFLGSSLAIDPFFLASHVYTPYREISMQTPNLATLPSRNRHQRYFNTHYHRTLELPERCDYLRQLHTVRAMNISRKLAVLPPTHGTSIGLAQHALSIHLFTQEEHGGHWLCLMLVDSSIPNGLLSLDSRDKTAKERWARFNLRTKLFLSGYEDFLDPPEVYTASADAWEPPSRLGMLEDLTYYWSRKWPADFDSTNPTLLSLCFYPLKIIAAEWMNVLAVMNYHIKRYEYSIEGQKTIAQDLDRLNTDLNSLQRWKRRNLSSQQKIRAIRSFVDSHVASHVAGGLTTTIEQGYSMNPCCLVDDFAYLTTSLTQYSERLESMLPVVMSLVQISDTRRSLAEAANISRLTYLAFVFVPLSFTSSLFSMNADISPGGRQFWIYFAVAVPITAAAFLLARPPGSPRAWLQSRIFPARSVAVQV